MPVLTQFQLNCREALDELLEHEGVSLRSSEIVGNGECFIHAVVEGHDAEVWIYDDEAEYRVCGRHVNYEAAGYRSEPEQIGTFIRGLQKQLRRLLDDESIEPSLSCLDDSVRKQEAGRGVRILSESLPRVLLWLFVLNLGIA